jgi:hypothetical protein
MPFEWDRIDKAEENFVREISNRVFSYVCEFYQVENIIDLSQDLIQEIIDYRDNHLHEYSVMQAGFSDLISMLESNINTIT